MRIMWEISDRESTDPRTFYTEGHPPVVGNTLWFHDNRGRGIGATQKYKVTRVDHVVNLYAADSTLVRGQDTGSVDGNMLAFEKEIGGAITGIRYTEGGHVDYTKHEIQVGLERA